MIRLAIALGFAIVLASMGDILFSRGMQNGREVRFQSYRDVVPIARCVFTRPLVLLGILCMAGYFGAYMAALAWVDVSVANPLTALSYLIATGYAALILRERICAARWLGVALVILGAICVGLSS